MIEDVVVSGLGRGGDDVNEVRRAGLEEEDIDMEEGGDFRNTRADGN